MSDVAAAEEQSRGAEGAATSKLNDIENTAQASEQAAQANTAAAEAKNGQTDQLNGKFLEEIENKGASSAGDADQEREKEITTVEGNIEALKAENTAAFAGVQSSLENAQATSDRDEADILQAEQDLWFLANETSGHLQEFMNVSGTQIETFHARLQDEKDSLQKSMAYLNNYESYTEWQSLNLLEVEIELVSTAVGHAGTMFEKMEKKEAEFARRVSSTMNSDAFQTLKQIYDANVFVQKATREDDEIVNDLETHEKKALPWMQEVLVALNDAHEEMLLAEQAGGQMSQNMAGQASAHTSDALAALAGEVASETNDTSSATLDSDVDQTVKMMSDEGAVASKNDNATLQMLENRASENANNVQGEINKVASELGAIETVTANASNSLNAVDRILSGFEKQNKKMLEKSREGTSKRMADTFKSFNEESFLETHDAAEIRANGVLARQAKVAVKALPALPSPARPRLQSLLDQHDQLAKLHAGLSVRHVELGKQVSEVAEIGRDFHQLHQPEGFRK
jgi:hypothetical protein